MRATMLTLLLLGLYASSVIAVDICEEQDDGTRLAHPADCTRYIVCEKKCTAQISTCPFGLHFNRFLGLCDVQERAGCAAPLPLSTDCDCSSCCGTTIPVTSVTPGTPNTPVTPVTPDTPVTPVTPETPVTPVTPDTPVTPVTPDTPVTPVTPDTPVTPVTPDTPVTPVTPDTPVTTVTPDTPVTPVTPDIPVTPVTPHTPVTPDTPVTPVTPDTPVTPVTPDTPVTPVTPDTPVTPVTPDIPVTPVTPNTPVTPGTPVTPDTPGTTRCNNDLDVCIGKPNNFTQRYEGNCQKWIVCQAECALVLECPNNLIYDMPTNICNYPQYVDCPYPYTPPSGPSAGPSGTSCTQPGKCANLADGEMVEDSTNSNRYIVCQCNCEQIMTCPVGLEFNIKIKGCDWPANGAGVECPDGLVYNATAKYCDWPAGFDQEIGNINVTCENDSTICKDKAEGALLAVDGVCNEFYKCNFGCAVTQICPNNLVYNSVAQYCDYPQNYKCPWPYTPPSGPSAGPSGIACPSGGRCATEKEGKFLNSTSSCDKYVVCQCGCEVEMSCPEGLNFDTTNNVCNFPQNVKCTI